MGRVHDVNEALCRALPPSQFRLRRLTFEQLRGHFSTNALQLLHGLATVPETRPSLRFSPFDISFFTNV